MNPPRNCLRGDGNHRIGARLAGKRTWELNRQRNVTTASASTWVEPLKGNFNDVEKLYNDKQISFSLLYHWRNGDIIKPQPTKIAGDRGSLVT